MKFDIGGRRSGKTTRMIQWLLNGPAGENRILVTHSPSEAARIREILKEMGIERNDIEVIDFASTVDRLRGKSAVVGIDNLEMLLANFLGANRVTRVAATGELYTDD